MYVSSLSLRNYRNFRSAKFKFVEEGANTIIGENAAGKSNVFNAMRLILDESIPSNARYLAVNDFNRSIGDPRGHWIVITLDFGGLGVTDEELVIAQHAAQLTGNSAFGTYSFVFRPKYHIRKLLFDKTHLLRGRAERIEALRDIVGGIAIDKEYYEAVAFTRSSADFSCDDIYSKFVGDFSNARFPDPDDEDASQIGNLKPAYFSLVKEVACTFVKAMRNVVADLRYARSNPLLSLLSKAGGGEIDVDDARKIVNTAKELNSLIGRLDQIRSLSGGIRKTILEAVGQTYSPSIEISSNVPEEMSALIQSLGLLAEDGIADVGTGSLDDISLGGANLIYIALKLHEYESQIKKEGKIAHFLLIEEPEAHIHTHIQKTLFSRFSSRKTQIFVSTHSSQISSAARLSGTNVISRKAGCSEVFWPGEGLEKSETIRIERYLDAVRSTLLFAKSVIICEGDAEQILIPFLVRQVLGVSLDEMGISLLCIDGTVFTHVASLFHSQRLRNYCAIITDQDSAFIREPTEYASQKYVDHLLASEESGLQRARVLAEQFANNKYVATYFSKNTFEVDLFAAGNASLFIKSVEQMYTLERTKRDVIADLTSVDKNRQYFRALQLAEKAGKGWYALLLSDGVDKSARIPVYILRALRHALTEQATTGLYRQMIDYRLKAIGSSLAHVEGDVGEDIADIISTFEDMCPHDCLLELFK
ncbi:chromosome segregation protein SMC [Xanthomonas sp. MLO165]|uniref:ATP-dependent nuclease n=1 Tax=Xanthomonas sp. MLO165 TaxID=2081477 RepID=UPI001C040BB9|nr:AAA family ATPase [Xanthomonas sp. MLO165]QWM97971.1 chromosome segregation protein SMC [Xanthomonas sp. MLO165]